MCAMGGRFAVRRPVALAAVERVSECGVVWRARAPRQQDYEDEEDLDDYDDEVESDESEPELHAPPPARRNVPPMDVPPRAFKVSERERACAERSWQSSRARAHTDWRHARAAANVLPRLLCEHQRLS
jgi:hypothetical protein